MGKVTKIMVTGFILIGIILLSYALAIFMDGGRSWDFMMSGFLFIFFAILIGIFEEKPYEVEE